MLPALEGLTEKQQAFVTHLVETGSAEESVRAAGYSTNNIHVAKHQLLNNPRIQKAISNLTLERLASLAPRAVSVVESLAVSAKSEYVRLQAAQDLLDRAGFKPPERVDHRVSADLTVHLDLGVNQPVDSYIQEEGVKN